MASYSAFEFYGIGVVADVKERGATTVMVTPREQRFAHQELVDTNPQREDKTVKTNNGERVVKATNNKAIECTWLAVNSMRKTAPDVRNGDEVLIYTLGDDRYFWMLLNTADHKRLETVIFAISADPNNPLKDDFSNAYFISLSSHEKQFMFRLNKVDGEVTGYTIECNAKDGYLSASDDFENGFFIKSKERVVGLENADRTTVQCDKEDANIYAPRNINLTAEERIAMRCKKLFAKCEDWEVNASNSYKVNTPNAEFSERITTPSAIINGVTHENHKHISNGPGKPTNGPQN
ncbi:MAG: hypothetical protein ACRCUB_02515 [Plesiomonas shigelloides]|uniref:hypothetical protein n=1 Tax=Clostridium sp. TaxID=1506 RepID=UPI003EE424C7